MLFDFKVANDRRGDFLVRPQPAARDSARRWSVDSEHGRLTDVLVSPPPPLDIGPCRSAAIGALARNLEAGAAAAARQHAALVRTLRDQGVRCATLASDEALPDLVFTRDAALMTPWGLLGLRPGTEHRRRETGRLLRDARGWGLPYLGRIEQGALEGGDVCLLRPGVAAIGWSGERTDKQGALALARLFETHGWTAILTHFDADFGHLGTLFAMVDRHRALACIEALDPAFVGRVRALGIDLVPVTPFEVQRLGTDALSLGDGRVLRPAEGCRINAELERLGHEVVRVEIGAFASGGGLRALTLPLARLPG